MSTPVPILAENSPSVEFSGEQTEDCDSNPVEAAENTPLRRSTRVSKPSKRLSEEILFSSLKL